MVKCIRAVTEGERWLHGRTDINRAPAGGISKTIRSLELEVRHLSLQIPKKYHHQGFSCKNIGAHRGSSVKLIPGRTNIMTSTDDNVSSLTTTNGSSGSHPVAGHD